MREDLGFAEKVFYNSNNVKNINLAIQEWVKSDSGINSNSESAHKITSTIKDLIAEAYNEAIKSVPQGCCGKSETPDVQIYSSYSQPIRSSAREWIVYVTKYQDNQFVSVISHKFSDEESAKLFSTNNWNLGEYF